MKPRLRPLDLQGEFVILILFNRMLSTKICLESWVRQQRRLLDYLQLLTRRVRDFPEIERAFLVQ